MAIVNFGKSENNNLELSVIAAEDGILTRRTVVYVIKRTSDSADMGKYTAILEAGEEKGAIVEVVLKKNTTYTVYASIFDSVGNHITTTAAYEVFLAGELDLFLAEQTAVGQKLVNVTWSSEEMLGSSYAIYAAAGDSDDAEYYLKASGVYQGDPMSVVISVDKFGYYTIKLVLTNGGVSVTSKRAISVYESSAKPSIPKNVRVSRKDIHGNDILIGVSWDDEEGYEYSITGVYFENGKRYSASVQWNRGNTAAELSENPFNISNIYELPEMKHGEKCSIGIDTYSPLSGKFSDTVWLNERYIPPAAPSFSATADEDGIISVICKCSRYFTYINALISKRSDSSAYLIQASKRLYLSDMNEKTGAYGNVYYEGRITVDAAEYGSGDYMISGRAYIDDVKNNEYGIRSSAGDKAYVKVSLPAPKPFTWTYPKTKGGDFNLTAAEWNGLLNSICSLYAYSGKTAPSMTRAYAGDKLTAAMYNEAGNAIRGYTDGAGAFIPIVYEGDEITADDKSIGAYGNNINVIVSELNAVINNLQKEG